MAPRRIVICFDGTGNEVGDRESNVLKLYKGLRQDDTQIVHYVPGVGTLSGPRLFVPESWTKFKSLMGLAFGLGLEDDVLDAYRFLCRTWREVEDKAEKDRIYIFGFSRGAYAARLLAGFLHNFGVIRPERLHLVTGAFRAYRLVTDLDRATPDDITFKKLRQFADVLDPDPAIPIRALGLFDTVASLARFSRPLRNLALYRSPMELGTHANVMRNRSVRIVLHAQAIDERRSMFRALPWVPSEFHGNRFKNPSEKRTQYVEQRWFPGYHSDIGGTPKESFSGIGKITLLWMLDRLAEFEDQADAEDGVEDTGTLRLRPAYRKRRIEGQDRSRTNAAKERYARPHPLSPTHDSMAAAWLPLEVLPKTTKRREWPNRRGWGWYIPWSEPRVISEGHKIDQSVYDRMDLWRFYRPENVPARGEKSTGAQSPYLTPPPSVST